MIWSSQFDHIFQAFADQFEADDTSVFYRKNMKGAPIQVTEAERDGFIDTFRRRILCAFWSLFPAVLLLTVFLVLFISDEEGFALELALYVGLAVILIPYLFAYYWAWTAPARELGRRPRAGEARTNDEVRRLMLAKTTDGQLGFAAVAAILLVWQISAETDVFNGWGVLWLVFAVALVCVASIRAFRKWRQERD